MNGVPDVFWGIWITSIFTPFFTFFLASFAAFGPSWDALGGLMGSLLLTCLGDWKNISITHLIIIIKSEVSTFPIVVIFFRGCVSEMVVLSYSVIYYIYIPGTLVPCFHYWCSVYGICKWSDTLWPVGRVRLFADYTISLSSLCRLIWRHWTTKCLSGIWCRVCV